MLKKRFTKALVSLGCALVFALAALLGVFYSPDQMLADALYQRPKALDGNIFVIGIDDRAIDDIGPYQTWGRDVMAMEVYPAREDRPRLRQLQYARPRALPHPLHRAPPSGHKVVHFPDV